MLWADGQPAALERTSDRTYRVPVEVARRLFAASGAELVVSGVRFRFAPETLVGLSRIAHSLPPPAGVCRD